MYRGIIVINNRIKKLIGTIIIPMVDFLYGIVAVLAEILLPNLNGFMIFLFIYSWFDLGSSVLPIISWMQKKINQIFQKLSYLKKNNQNKIDIAIIIFCNLYKIVVFDFINYIGCYE